MSEDKIPDRVTVEEACRIVGGDKPIDIATYYRSANLGILPRPKKVLPNTSRVDRAELMAAIAARTKDT